MEISKKKETLLLNGFCRSGGRRRGNSRKRKDRQILRPCQRTKTVMEHEDEVDTIFVGALRIVSMGLNKWLEEMKGLEEMKIRGKKSKQSRFYHCWFVLFWFYGISTFVGYLMPNPVYTYTLHIDLILWQINHWKLFNTKAGLYI